MSFNLYYSNHLDTLQYITGYLTKVDPQESPFDKEYFLVQNFGMARWMQIKLAKQLGILTQAEFLLPAKMLMNLLETIFSEEERAQRPIERLSKDQLFWPLVKIIDDMVSTDQTNTPDADVNDAINDDLFAPIKQYLQKYEKDAQSKRTRNPLLGILHLSEELASIFDKYIVYRSSWINAWTQGELAPSYFDNVLPIELEAWQMALFRKLYEALGHPLHFGMLPPLIDQKLQDPHIQQKLPKRLFIIGLNSLPPLFLDLIAQFSKAMDIHLFFNNPSQYYWGDLIKGTSIPHFDLTNFFAQQRSNINPVSPYIPEELVHQLDEYWQNSYGNPLLASLGKVGRDHLHLLQKFDGELDLHITEAFSEPEVSSLLTKIQAEVYHLKPTNESEKYPLPADDHSIQVHVTYSPMREVEALYNRILHELMEKPDLEPQDIVVMTPDIEAYAPFIHAIFGSAPHDRYLPYSISDVSIKESETIFTTLLQLLSLPESTFKASDLLMLIQMPEIMEKFHFEEQDLALIHFWIHDANIKQALDGQQLTEELQVDYNEQFDWDINTWRWGLERMLLGYGSETESITLLNQNDHTLAPYAHVEGKNAEILGNLCHFIDELNEARILLTQERVVTQWRLILPLIWQKFFTETTINNDKLHFTQKIWQNLLNGADTVSFEKELPLKALIPMLENKLLEEKPEQNFIQGKITFCSFIPMRTIPFKMIAMIGMNQSDFPKSSVHHGFDLMQYQRMRGDRNRNTDDRYLFLEAILSAKETLYLSYIGKSIRDNSDTFPSLLIDELLRYIDQIAIAEKEDGTLLKASNAITFMHPMASYNDILFQEKSAIQSYQNEWILIQNPEYYYTASYDYESLIKNYEQAQKTTPLTDITLDNLIRFYQNPTDYFAEVRLNIASLKDYTTLIEDDEIFTIHKGLDEFQFNRAMTDAFLKEFPHNHGDPERSLKNTIGTDPATIYLELDDIANKLYSQHRLEGSLPKFAYGKIAWDDKVSLPKDLAGQLIDKAYPYGEFEMHQLRAGIILHGKVPSESIAGEVILWDVGQLDQRRRIRAEITNLFYHATKSQDTLHNTVLFFYNDKTGANVHTCTYYTKDDATQQLKHLIQGYLYGISAPIPYLVSKESGKSCFQDPFFLNALMEVRTALPHLINIPLESWRPQLFTEILKDDTYINSLSETIRNELNKVKSYLIGNNAFIRLFPQFGEKEVFAFILFYNHYLDELMSYEP